MNYYSKYLKYKMKYIELQKAYLIGGSKKSAKELFITTLQREGRFELFREIAVNDETYMQKITDDLTEANLDKLFDSFYEALKNIFVGVDRPILDTYIEFIVKSYLNNTFWQQSPGEPLTSSLKDGHLVLNLINQYRVLLNARRNNSEYLSSGFILRDINTFNGISGGNSLKEYINENRELVERITELTPLSNKKIKKLGTKLPVFENDRFVVYIPKTEEEAIIRGRNTRWCTAGSESTKWFNKYNKEGPLYIFISKEDEKIKYQLHVEYNALTNSNNEDVELKKILNTTETATPSDIKLLRWLINEVLVNYVGFNIEDEKNFSLHNSIFKHLPDFYLLIERSLNRLTQEQRDKIESIYIYSNDIRLIRDILSRFTNFKKLLFDGNFNIPLANYLYKLRNLRGLLFSGSFNQPLENSLVRLNLVSLLFIGNFNQPLGNSLSRLVNLTKLKLSGKFNKPLGRSLENLVRLVDLELSGTFNQHLEESLLKLVSLRKLKLSGNFNKSLGRSLSNLARLEDLELSGKFNQDLMDSLSRLVNLRSLKLNGDFNKTLGRSLEKLVYLEDLELSGKFNQDLRDSLSRLVNLRILNLIGDFNKTLGRSLENLESLEELGLRGKFNQKLGHSLSNLISLDSLILNGEFNQPFGDSLSNLEGLTILYLNQNYSHPLDSLSVLRNLNIDRTDIEA
jgi:hypothetical protein